MAGGPGRRGGGGGRGGDLSAIQLSRTSPLISPPPLPQAQSLIFPGKGRYVPQYELRHRHRAVAEFVPGGGEQVQFVSLDMDGVPGSVL